VQFEEVVALHNGGKYKEAEKLYNLLLEKRPDDPTLLYCLGTLYTQMEREAVGVVLLRAAIRQLPKHASAWANLAYGLKKIGHRREAALAHQKAIELDPTNSDWYSNFAADYIGNGDPEPAIPLLAKAIELNPNNPHAHWHMGLALLELGDFENGWPQYDWGFLANQRLVRNYEVDWWNGDRDQTVVVYTEQGMGDEIMFASMLPDLIAVSKSVILDCNPRLEQLFRQSFPEITVYGTRKDETISWPRNHQIDAKIAIASRNSVRGCGWAFRGRAVHGKTTGWSGPCVLTTWSLCCGRPASIGCPSSTRSVRRRLRSSPNGRGSRFTIGGKSSTTTLRRPPWSSRSI